MTDRDVIRHLLAVIAYRGGKFIRNAPPEFAGYDTGDGRTPLTILAHISDLFDWTMTLVQGESRWKEASPVSWEAEVARFHAALATLDARIASETPIRAEWTRVLQGPIADALTHVGQLAILRRMSGSPVVGENYFVADIVTGRLGPDQAPPRKPFQ